MPISLPSRRATIVSYLADSKGRRVSKRVDGVKVQGFLYQDAPNPVAELDGNNAIVARFVYGSKSHVPDYMFKEGQTYRIISDHLGSVRLVVNSSTGTVAQRLDYDEYGVVINDSQPGFQPFAYAGGLYDVDTGLVRFGMRDYDASVGRWVQSDPIGLMGGLNTYAYVGGNPINYIDPLGLANISIGLRGGIFEGTVGAAGAVTGGVDTNGNVCVQISTCARTGLGSSANIGGSASVGSGNFCEGETTTGGVFAGGGLGPFASGSTTTNPITGETSVTKNGSAAHPATNPASGSNAPWAR
jgi:RHS repeat-associated protein